jgi:hypothetical protein
MILNIFFSIKIIRQSRGEGELLKALPKRTIFQNPGGHVPPDNTGSAPGSKTGIISKTTFENLFILESIRIFF